jgi:preprotein translocase subunit SecB
MGLSNSRTRLDRADLIRLRRTKGNEIRKIDSKYEVVDAADDHFDVSASFNLELVNKDTKEIPLAIECSIAAHFHGKSPLPKELADRFAQNEFRLVVWPFFRQFVFDTTARMAVYPVTIPLSDNK